MGKFEKTGTAILCAMAILAGILLAVLGFNGSYGDDSPMLFFGAALFITVPAVILFGWFGGKAAEKRGKIDPVRIIAGLAMALIGGGMILCMKMIGVISEAGLWLIIPVLMVIAGGVSILQGMGIVKSPDEMK